MLAEYHDYLGEGEKAGARYAMGRPRRAPAGQAGIQMGHRVGSSLEFRDHREYQPGDDVRRIDWNAFARSDRLTVKLYHEEVSPHVDVMIDASRSMALENTAKVRATLGMAALVATAAANSGYTFGAWIARDRVDRVENGSDCPSRWGGIDFGYRGEPSQALSFGFSWTRPGMRFLLTDLLWPGDPWRILSRFADRSTAVVVIQILAAADVDPAGQGSVRLVDSETEVAREIFVDAREIHRYRQSLDRHQQSWHRACRHLGAIMTTVVAEDVVKDWRLEKLVASAILTPG